MVFQSKTRTVVMDQLKEINDLVEKDGKILRIREKTGSDTDFYIAFYKAKNIEDCCASTNLYSFGYCRTWRECMLILRGIEGGIRLNG
jgi:hypothetical protein